MITNPLPAPGGKPQVRPTPTVSAVLPDERIVEMTHDRKHGETEFVVWDKGDWTIEKEIEVDEEQKLVPFSPKNNLLQNEVILFPSKPEEYGSEHTLITEIENYIHKYVDVSPQFEKVASYYVLFTWIYDGFNELPYLRLRGDTGCGKTRFLQTVGPLCYKPIFASGASSISPLFRILDSVRGTLIIDESDFKMSDEKSEIVKIFNNGNVKGFPVLRSELTPTTKEFNPRAYQVFGPKIIATRGFFEDRALESRCLTEDMGLRPKRKEIPINLPDSHKEEALRLRNKLLLFRFRNFRLRPINQELVDGKIEDRLNQIFVPLLSIINNPLDQAEIKELARQFNQQLISDRGMDIEAQVLDVIKDISSSLDAKLTVKQIWAHFVKEYGAEYDHRITTKYIGYVIRKKLGLHTDRSEYGYVIPPTEQNKLRRLYERYGLAVSPSTPPRSSGSSASSGIDRATAEHPEHAELPTGDKPPESQPMPPDSIVTPPQDS